MIHLLDKMFSNVSPIIFGAFLIIKSFHFQISSDLKDSLAALKDWFKVNNLIFKSNKELEKFLNLVKKKDYLIVLSLLF